MPYKTPNLQNQKYTNYNKFMEAVLLIGGSGSRMSKIKKSLPKCLLEINGKPFLFWSIKYLLSNNVNKIILSMNITDYHIKNFVQNLNQDNLNLILSEEKNNLGTGGAIKHAMPHINNRDFIIINGDVLFDISIPDLYKKHEIESNDLTYALLKLKNQHANYGEINFNKKGMVTNYRYGNHESKSKIIDSGLRIINQNKLNKYLNNNDNKSFSFENDLVPWFIENKKVGSKIYNSDLYDIGNPESYKECKLKFKNLSSKLQT